MDSLLTLLTLLTAVGGVVIAGSALNSRSGLERAFFTHEQKTKAYFYNLLVLSGLFSFSFTFLLILLSNFRITTESSLELSWSPVALIWITLFIFFMLVLEFTIKTIDSFFIKHHYKYKVFIPSIGEVYIISMLNEDICICSTDANINLKPSNQISYLIEKNTILLSALTKEKISKPDRSFVKKLVE